jgi:hypothetical protein
MIIKISTLKLVSRVRALLSIRMKIFGVKNIFSEIGSFNISIANFFGYLHFNINNRANGLNSYRSLDEYLRLLFYVIFGFLSSLKGSSVNIGSRNSLILTIGITILLQLTIFMPTIFRIFNFIVRD